MDSGASSAPSPPSDPEVRNIIDKLAQFVARNGPAFENMTKTKQRDNPKFGFLFGGEHFHYYTYKVNAEQARLHYQQRQQQPPPPAGYPGQWGQVRGRCFVAKRLGEIRPITDRFSCNNLSQLIGLKLLQYYKTYLIVIWNGSSEVSYKLSCNKRMCCYRTLKG